MFAVSEGRSASSVRSHNRPKFGKTTHSRQEFDLDGDVYRRRIAITTVEPGVVVSDLEDDFHHFVITLRHDGRRVESVRAESERWPWSTCPAAAEPLRKLANMPLER